MKKKICLINVVNEFELVWLRTPAQVHQMRVFAHILVITKVRNNLKYWHRMCLRKSSYCSKMYSLGDKITKTR